MENALKEQAAQEKKLKTMTETPVKKLILKLAFPTMVSMMITSVYNMADTYFVAHIGQDAAATSATAAVGIAFPLMAVIQAFGFMFGHGSGNFISRALGRKDMKDAEAMAATGFFSALFAGCMICLTGLLFLTPLVRLLGATKTIEPYAVEYVRFILIGAPWMTASLVLNNQLRFQGNAMFAMIGIGTGGLLNIALDPLFIFVFGMGISGAALATIISQLVSFALLFLGTRKSDNLNIRLRNFSPNGRYYLEILKGGSPSLFRQGIGSVSTACLNIACGAFGDPAIAAMSIVSRVMTFAASLVIGFGQGFQPVCGFNYGAKKYGRVREGYAFCVKYSTIFLLFASAALIAFAPTVMTLFRADDAAVVKTGALALRLQAVTLPLIGMITIANMMMQTLAQTMRASLVALARQGIFFIPLILLLPVFFGLLGVQLAQPISDVLSFALAFLLQRGLLRKIRDLGDH